MLLLHDAFRHFDYLGGKDWNAFLGQAQAELTTLRDYHQLPLWNPWRRGGQVSLAQPESMFFSPVTPLAMLFGVVPAFKLLLLPLFLAGCLGMWSLAGHLGLRGASRLVPGLVFFGASLFPLYVVGGLPNWLAGMALLPWIVLFHRRAMEERAYGVAAAAAYAALLYSGSIHHFVYFPLLLGLDAAVLALTRRSARPLLSVAAVLVAGVLLASLRVVPLLEVFAQFPREIEATGRHLTLPLVWRALLGTGLPELSTLHGPWVESGGTAVYWVNAGSYVGPLAVALAGLGLVARPRASAGPAAFGAVFLWLSLGSGIHPSLWNALHALPVFASMQAPARLILPVTFALALLAGHGFAVAERAVASGSRLPATLRRTLPAVGLIALVAPMLLVNRPIAAHAFIVRPTPGLVDGGWFAPRRDRPPFAQTRVLRHPAQFGGSLYDAVLRNEGNLVGVADIPACRGTRARGRPNYRGEAYLREGSGVPTVSITPDLISVQVDAAQDDRLVINQCYFPGWRAEGTVSGELVASRSGLLSLPLPAGRHDLELRYRPASVPIGAALTSLACLIGWLYLRAARR